MNLTKTYVEIRGTRRFAIAAACMLVALATCASALALRMEVFAPVAQTESPSLLKVDARKMAALIVYRKDPVYPAEAKANNDTLDGPVVLEVIINEEGVPQNIRIKQSLRDDYDRSALDAVQDWRWKPFHLNGNPIKVETTVTINYTFKDE